jgi:SAM-dependent methyltransferase
MAKPKQVITRSEQALSKLNLSGRGLEIGGGYSPIVTKADFNVDHLDRADTTSLVAKYAAQDIDTSRIQPVDFVWTGQPYAALVGDRRYDWIIASHVIEHVPDPITFLKDCSSILTDEGVLSLVVPDKRFCFDFYRPASGLARFIDAHVRAETKTSVGATIEHIINAAAIDGRIAWDAAQRGVPRFVHSLEQARQVYNSIRGDDSPDIHVWAFTPYSFRLLTEDFWALGLTDVRECSWHEGQAGEFFIQLSRRGQGPEMDRAALALRALSS